MHVSAILLGLTSGASLVSALPQDLVIGGPPPQNPKAPGSSATNASSSWPEYTNKTAFESAILKQTNEWRAYHSAPDVAWSLNLEEYAQDWANKCIKAHSNSEEYGENLAYNKRNPAYAVYDWAEESADYDYEDAVFIKGTGHFTQLVWKDTKFIGCARKFCGGTRNPGNGNAWGWFTVCEYWPKGNIQGKFAENVLPPPVSDDPQDK